nr:hypothetical protein [Acinetobacter dispersus]
MDDEIENAEYGYLNVKNKFNSLRKMFELMVLNKVSPEKISNGATHKELLEDIDFTFDAILESFDEISSFDYDTGFSLAGLILNIEYEIENFVNNDNEEKLLFTIFSNMRSFESSLNNAIKISNLKKYEESAKDIINDLNEQKKELEETISQSKILSDDLKNKKVHEIFEDDSENFKKIARRYEISFYMVLAFLFLYFFGWYVEIDTANFKFKFAEQFHGNHTPTFYIQKISLLILSTTLAAYLLKRSFMNRRLADEAYRTAKELDALPRYMDGMPDEMKEKLRFDLAYKYFGNGIHHDSYTGGENLMHENIKANTEFLKSVKDLSSSNVDKVKSESDQ